MSFAVAATLTTEKASHGVVTDSISILARYLHGSDHIIRRDDFGSKGPLQTQLIFRAISYC